MTLTFWISTACADPTIDSGSAPTETGAPGTEELPAPPWPTLQVEDAPILLGREPYGRLGNGVSLSSDGSVASVDSLFLGTKGVRAEARVWFADGSDSATLVGPVDGAGGRTRVWEETADSGFRVAWGVTSTSADSGSIYLFAPLAAGAVSDVADAAVTFNGGNQSLLGFNYLVYDATADGLVDLVATSYYCDEHDVEASCVVTWDGPWSSEEHLVDADRVIATPRGNSGQSDGLLVGDVDGDGDTDLVGGMSDDAGDGIWWVPGTDSQATTILRADDDGDMGYDIDVDGFDDIITGGPLSGDRDGQVGVFFGPFDGTRLMSEADTWFVSAQPLAFLGCSVAIAPDLDGDDSVDLLLGACQDPYYGEPFPGRVWVYPGTLRGRVDTYANATLDIVGPTDREGFGTEVEVGDTNHDGLDDLLIGAPHGVGETVEAGRVYRVDGAAIRAATAP